MRVLLATIVSLVALTATAAGVQDRYLDRYFRTFPTRATMAGRHDFDRELESLDAKQRASWLAFNRATRKHLGSSLDDELLRRAIDREIFQLTKLQAPERNPLYWTEIIGNSVVFLLVRDHDNDAAIARAKLIPRLVRNAEASLHDSPRELSAIAASQARASAKFFREGFVVPEAAQACEQFASFIERGTGTRGTGFSPSSRAEARPTFVLGPDLYRENFRLATGISDVDATLARAERDLIAKRKEAAAYGRSVWKEVMDGEAPSDDVALLRALFDRLGRDHAKNADDFVAYGTRLVDEAEAFVRAHDIVTLPEPRTLVIGRSPAYFVGQSVGGVYPAGPYAPDAPTLYFLPMPSDPAGRPGDDAEAFFRDFNDHFMRMITPHEILPGHYVQLKIAAHNVHKIRAVFPDDVYVEGWGTFCERLLLDEGWGGPLDRLAHLKKQMENIARTIADIRVHTRGMTREELRRFVIDEALQGEQLARNMWTRSITTSPQLTYYYLGYREVRSLYDDVRRARGAKFRLRDFMDELLLIGPVPLADVRRIMLRPHRISATVHSNKRSES
jgi:hypothetical protein